jgi:hypothetical protein
VSVKPPKEADVQRAVIQFLELVGAVCVRCNGGAVKVEGRFVRFNRTASGSTSDVLACLPGGKFAAVEVKAARGKLTDGQGAFLDAVRRKGGLGLVVRSVAELAAALAAEGFDVGG